MFNVNVFFQVPFTNVSLTQALRKYNNISDDIVAETSPKNYITRELS